MAYRVEALKRCVWDDSKSEIIELPDIYGYCVVGHDGRTIAEGETRSEAMERASAFILLPQ